MILDKPPSGRLTATATGQAMRKDQSPEFSLYVEQEFPQKQQVETPAPVYLPAPSSPYEDQAVLGKLLEQAKSAATALSTALTNTEEIFRLRDDRNAWKDQAVAAAARADAAEKQVSVLQAELATIKKAEKPLDAIPVDPAAP